VSFVRSLTLRAFSEAVSKLGGTVLLLVSARALGVERFGVFALAWATGWLLSLVADMGIHMATARRAARETEHVAAPAGVAFVAKALWSIAAVIGLAGAAHLLFDGTNEYVVFAVGIGLLAMSFVDLVQHYYRGRGWFGRDATLQIGSRLALLVFGLAGLTIGELRGLATGVLVAGTSSALVSGVALVADCGRPRFGPQLARSTRRLVGEALPVGLGALVSVLAFRVDVYLLEAFRDEAAVGLYSSAYKLFEASQALPAVLMSVVFPRLAAVSGERSQTRVLRRRSLVGLALAGLIVTSAGSIAAHVVIDLLYGEAFADAALPFAVLCWAAPIMFVNYFLTQDLIARGRARAFAGGAASALVVNLALNIVLIPRYGAVGAAAVTIVSEVALLAVCVVALRTRG
jgi:O-antigen/teichoic acid export membrane protein